MQLNPINSLKVKLLKLSQLLPAQSELKCSDLPPLFSFNLWSDFKVLNLSKLILRRPIFWQVGNVSA